MSCAPQDSYDSVYRWHGALPPANGTLSRTIGPPHQGRPLNFSLPDLLERDGELATLGAALDGVRAGRGRLLVIEGPAGRGKSALLAALRERAADDGMRVVDGRGGELERAFAFGTIRQLFERTFEDAGPAERERLLAGAAAPAASILAADASARAESGFGAFHAIYWLATNLSLERPLMIAVDDLHWVDEPSLRALSYLARRIADLAIALVVALRPAEPGAPQELLDELRSQPDAPTANLRPLSAGAVAALVSRAIPAADDELCAACFETSAGNPFYLHELLVSLDGDVSAEHARRAAVPELGDRIVRRIDRIGPAAAALAHAMAVLGDGGSLDAAAEVAGVELVEAAAIASQLRRVEVLAHEDPFTFAHPLVRHSVYDSLSVAERDRAHADAARVLRAAGAAPGVVATHLRRLRPAGSADVVTGLRAAAQEALSRGAPEAAAAALQRALEERAPEPPRAVLLSELGEIEVLARDLAALEHLTEAARLAEDPVLRARVAGPLSTILAVLGRWDELRTLLAEGIDGLGDAEPELRLDLEAIRAVILANHSTHIGEYVRDVPRLLELAQGGAWASRALCAVIASIWASRAERLDEVLPLVELGLRDGRLLRERGAAAWPAPQALCAFAIVDETARGLEVAEELLGIARRDGSAFGAIVATGIRGWMHGRRGDLARAEGDFQTVVDVALPNDQQLDLASMYWFMCVGIGERAGVDALAAGVEAIEPEGDFALTISGAMLCETRAYHRLARGDRDGAIADLRAAAAVYRPLDVAPLRSPWRSSLALALPADARDEAIALVEDELAIAERSGLPRPHGVALRAEAAVRGDDEVDRLRRSVELLERTDARLEHARSLVALGSALRRRGHRAEAREPLATAMELAHRGGADATAARALEELKATGARPRRRALTGIDALTVSEARVARLVAEGRANADVAQELFVSLKTIETHLTSVYSKLGLSGPGARRHLATALAEPAA
jgi:DNA-binding NarL/FixJ family response regulator